VYDIVVAMSCMQAMSADKLIRPISNPVWVDNVDVGTHIHPLFMHHEFPNKVDTMLGDVDFGGDLQLYAVQFEVQLADDLSLIAVKDGWIDFNPDNTADGAFSEEEGLADLGLGLKYVFHRNEESGLIASAKAIVELPTGDEEVLQGNGDGTITPAVAFAKRTDGLQLQGTLGYIQPLDDSESSMLYDSWHVSYALTETIIPLVELNHIWVTDPGDGGSAFPDQVGGAVPSVIKSEGADLVNFGASHADDNEHYFTVAVGLRALLTETIQVGAAYEFPLNDETENITDSRITIDAIFEL